MPIASSGRRAAGRPGPAVGGTWSGRPRGFRRTATTHRRSALAGVLLLAGCAADPGGDGGRRTPAVPVTVAAVARRDVPVEIRAIGTVEPYATVSVRSQVEGQVARVAFQEGQEVAPGELLFLIDPRPFEAALRRAEANRARDAADAANAEREAARLEQLLHAGVVSKDEYDRARTRAAATAAAAQADAAAVEAARLDLQYCSISSPIRGRLGEVLVHEGNVVKKNETILAVVNQLRPAYVAFSVPQQQLPAVRSRMSTGPLAVRASVGEDGRDGAGGELRFLDNRVDPTTGTVLLKALFANEDETLWPGQFVTVVLTLTILRDALVVPARAVETGQQGRYVYVVKPDRTVESRAVEVGFSVDEQAVIERGIEAGETVVTDGQLRLAPGAAVTVREGADVPGPAEARR